VLISAYSCGPNKGSEPGIGWNTVWQAAQKHDVWVITRPKNRVAIEGVLAEQLLPNVQFYYLDLPHWARLWKKGSRGVHLYFYLWQVAAFFAAKKLSRRIRFDVAHHITFGTYSYPSFLGFLGIPYIWGPVGGGESAPFAFWKTFGWKGFLFEAVRSMARKRGEWDPLVRRTAQKAAVAIATTEETATRVRSLGAKETITQSVAALDQTDLRALRRIPARNSGAIRIFSAGRLLHWKGFHLGIEAFSRLLLKFPESEYWMIGEGPERRRLENLAKRLGAFPRMKFFGELTRAETLQKMAECDVMLFPSMHDSGGWASVEAMAAGRPVICLDLGGPALQVDETTGYKIPATSPAESIQGIAQSLAALAKDRGLLERMSLASRARVEDQFNWSRVGEAFEELYQEIASGESKACSVGVASPGMIAEGPRSTGSVSLEKRA
jgi:glycosyltransferase involved in cell wall biosynthesis